MKKIFLFFIIIVMLLSLFGCSNNNISEKELQNLPIQDKYYYYFDSKDDKILHLTSDPIEEKTVEVKTYTYDTQMKTLYGNMLVQTLPEKVCMSYGNTQDENKLLNVEKIIIDDYLKLNSFSRMFSGFENTKEIVNANKLIFTGAELADNMFCNCCSLLNIDTKKWDLSNIKDTSEMFYECNSIVKLDTSKWDTNNVTSMNCMFFSCDMLKDIDVSNFIFDNCTDIAQMFQGCKSLEKLQTEKWNTKNIEDMRSVFRGCTLLNEIDVSNWDLSSLNYSRYIFAGCPARNTIDVDRFLTKTEIELSKKMKTAKYDNYYGSDVIEFGNYYKNNMDYKEPVEWLVLSDNPSKKYDGYREAKLISKYVVESYPWNENNYEFNDSNYKDNSTLSNLLEKDLYNSMFSKEEKKIILSKPRLCDYKEFRGNNIKEYTSLDEIYIHANDSDNNREYEATPVAKEHYHRSEVYGAYSYVTRKNSKSVSVLHYTHEYSGWDNEPIYCWYQDCEIYPYSWGGTYAYDQWDHLYNRNGDFTTLNTISVMSSKNSHKYKNYYYREEYSTIDRGTLIGSSYKILPTDYKGVRPVITVIYYDK